jgi:hypothetical protein
MILAATIMSKSNNYYIAKPCAVLDFIYDSQNKTLEHYPECVTFYNGTNPGQEAVVKASMSSGLPSEAGAALNMSFGMAGWLALVIHAFGVELYLRLTPGETERLRKVSYQRQLEAGMRNPGSAGLTADKLGDSQPWNNMPRKETDTSYDPSAHENRPSVEDPKTERDRML